jgi:hypothetical protein
MWSKIKNQAAITQLKGEMALIDRETNSRKRSFGVELYDLLGGERSVGMFQSLQMTVKEPYEIARADIQRLHAQKLEHQEELDKRSTLLERSRPAVTAGEKASKVGQWISNTGHEGKLHAQIALLDRQIRQRKEQFGMDVYAMLAPTAEETKKSSNPLKTQLSKLSKKEQEIEQCIERVKKDVASMEKRKQVKEREMQERQERGEF